MNWLFVLVIALFLILGFAGYRRGFVRMILSLTTLIICIVATAALAPKVRTFISEKTDWNVRLETSIYDKLVKDDKINSEVDSVIDSEGISAGQADESQVQDYVQKIMEKLSEAGFVLPAGESTQNRAEDIINETGTQVKTGICKAISESIAALIINIIVSIVLFIIILIIMRIIIRATDIITKLPVIHQANAILGLALGLAEALLIVWFILAVVSMGSSGELAGPTYSISNNWFLNFLYEKDPLIKLISK